MLFIIGRGRSGTTLLSAILNNYQDIFIAKEGMFLVNLYHKYKWRSNFSSYMVSSYFKDVLCEDKMLNWALSEGQLYKDYFSKRHNKNNLATLSYSVYQSAAAAKRKNVKVIGDKNPHHSLCIDVLLKIFPNAKFIWVIRDYRDNILSYQNVWFDLNDTAALAYRWLLFNQKIERELNKANNENYIQVRYEDLLTSSADVIKRILAFINVSYKSEEIEYKPINVKSQKWHNKISSPIDPSNFGKWKTQMSSDNIAIADSICGKYAKKFGYIQEIENKKVFLGFKASGFLKAHIMTTMEKLFLSIPFQSKFTLSNKIRSLLQ